MALLKLNSNWSALMFVRRLFVNNVINSSKITRCWNCDEPSPQVFCQSCNCLQKPNLNNNYFQLLGVDQDFNVSEVALSKKYKDLQKVLHPDKFSNKTQAEQKLSEEYSSFVNKAYSTLLNPLSRGIYMLGLKGYELPEKTDIESTFLHEIMERNEEVENADTPEEILRLEKENKAILSELQHKLNEALKTDNHDAAIKVLVRMKYFISIEEQIKSVIRNMNIVV